MTMSTTSIKITDNLIELTKTSGITWINVEALKAFLRKSGQSFNDNQILHEYLVFLQGERFIFDCTNTYFAIMDDVLFSFAKGKYSFEFRLDKLDFSKSSLEWKKIDAPINMLLRIRNSITVVSSDLEDDIYTDFLNVISSDIYA